MVLTSYRVLVLTFKTGAGLIRSLDMQDWEQLGQFIGLLALRFYLGLVLKSERKEVR